MPFYQYPPAGSAAGSAAVPTGGLYLDWSFRRGRPTNLTFVVVSGTATLQYWDDHDTPSPIISPTVGTGWHETDKVVQRLQVTGSGTVALVLNTPPQDIDIKALLAAAVTGTVTVSSITNPVPTDLGQQALGAIDPRQTTIVGQTVGLAPSATLAGAAKDPTLNTPQAAAPQPKTLQEEESQVPTAEVAVVVETIINAGTAVLPLGTLVTFNLTASTTSGLDATAYIAIRGATSGYYYAMLPTPVESTLYSTPSGASFPITTAEKINVVYLAIHGYTAVSFSWSGLTP